MLASHRRPGSLLHSPPPPTLVTKFRSLVALLLRKLLPSFRTPSNCPLGRVLTPSPPAASLSQRTPDARRATHCFGVELVPRLRQHFIHPRLVHESDEAETPARGSEGEADGYKAVSGGGGGRAGSRRRG